MVSWKNTLTKPSLTFLLLVLSLVFTIGCQTRSNPKTALDSSQPLSDSSSDSLSQVNKEQSLTKWLFVGDSLTAGFGLELEAAYVALMQQKIKKEHWIDPHSKLSPLLINAGISGDTSAGALRRIDWLLADEPTRVFLCIGANDGLRGQAISSLKENLLKMIKKLKKRGVQITLMGMQVPPNYGQEYSTKFKESYVEIALSEKLDLYPFLLDKVGGISELNQSDGIHPNHQGHQVIAEGLFNHILKRGYLIKGASPDPNVTP